MFSVHLLLSSVLHNPSPFACTLNPQLSTSPVRLRRLNQKCAFLHQKLRFETATPGT